MPSPIIHLEVGNYISQKLNIKSYDYFLGIIAPDAPNLEGFAEKDIRWEAHLRDSDYKIWKENAHKFYKKEKDNYPKDFIIGYCIHVLTDVIYDEFLYSKVRNEILKVYDQEIAHSIMGKDMSNYSFSEIENIKEILKEQNKSYNILNIDSILLKKWKEKQLTLLNSTNTSIYITKDIIDTLNSEVLNELMKYSSI